MSMELSVRHARYLPDFLTRDEQVSLLGEVVAGLRLAPLFRPVMPRTGKPLSVRMSNFGSLGWVADRQGYRYQSTHPDTGLCWPEIPVCFRQIWKNLLPDSPEPEACLVNIYDSSAKLGLHQDKDELDLTTPVLSISLGATALFRIGGTEKGGKTEAIKLTSGDVLILEGESRLAYHGVSRIYPGTSTLLTHINSVMPADGRVNVTLRRVNFSS